LCIFILKEANMSDKNPAFEKLTKILKLEIQLGYLDRAVLGGLSQFDARWQQESGDSAAVHQISELLRTYSTIEAIDQRKETIDRMLNLLIEPETESIEPQADRATPEQSVVADASRRSAERAAPTIEQPQSAPRPSTPRPDRGPALGLQSSVTTIQGIGPQSAERFEKLGIKTIHDLLYLLPRRYDDFSNLKTIGRLQYGDEVTVMGAVSRASVRITRGGAKIFQATLNDSSGAIQCTWFSEYLSNQIKPGMQIVVSGKVDEYLGRLTFQSPEWELLDQELLHTARIVPVYPLTEGLYNKQLRKIMKRTIDYWAPRLQDNLPDAILKSAGVMSLQAALLQIHFPDSAQSLEAARKRLAFDELFLLQLGLLKQKQQWRGETGRALNFDLALFETFKSALPFPLTEAQQRVLDDIIKDIRTDHPMSRLLQGDVGSGKTVVAAAMMFLAAQCGYQAALMAPTEILAEQHFKSLSQLFDAINQQPIAHPIKVRLLTGSTSQADRAIILDEIANGSANVVLGTHALIQTGVNFKALAAAIVDEQHRFGVQQRAMLRQKGFNPHILVMTATPIPRTLSLTLFGDLDLSVIDQMPPGRQPIETRILLPTERERAYVFIKSQIEKGRQVFIICPLVEESDKIEAKAAVEEHARLQKDIFPKLKLGLMHGRMKPAEKDEAMRAFANNETQILVSTSVVEVGIDVPNASVIMIEGAERFGLAQLHQFRGRVGRGSEKSYCLLQTDAIATEISERLKVVEASNDGFVLAEKDLELRGPGQFFGTRQSGLPDMHMTNIADARMIDLARREAEKLLAEDPQLTASNHFQIAKQLDEFWKSGQGDLS
jgi:ATP-dependent DNA helicase RecG